MPYDIGRLQRDIAQLWNPEVGFGSGRLVADDLVLTAAHVVFGGKGAAKRDGWEVRFEEDLSVPHAGKTVWCDATRDLALVRIVRPGGPPLRPALPFRVATVTTNDGHEVEARGYPRASKEGGPRKLTPAFGVLTIGNKSEPLTIGVEPSGLPDDPRDGWPGMSGSAVLLRNWHDQTIIWLYGVVQDVPGGFRGQLRVGRLAEVWREDRDFRALLVAAGARDVEGDDPTVHRIGNRTSTEHFIKPVFHGRLPPDFQSREADLATVRASLLGPSAATGIMSAARLVGLQGMGGVGKTVLATALALDPQVRSDFPDGIAWLTFGRGVPPLDKAAELARVLGSSGASFSSVSDARGRLGQITAERRLLVVLDDVWEPDAVDSFTGLGPDCRLLITTRDGRVLARARAERHELGLLDPAAARALLVRAAGDVDMAPPFEADAIVAECGRLPLALTAIGALVRHGTYTWANALAALREAALGELDTSWLPDPEQHSVAVVLKLSVDALSEEVRACFFDCAAFREDVDIPESTLLRLWSGRLAQERHAKRVAQELIDRSLLRRDGQRRYRLHDLYHDYLQHAAAPLADRHLRIIKCYRAACPAGWSSGPDDSYFFQHLPWHLHEAGETDELKGVLFDFRWLQRKLEIAGARDLTADCVLLERDKETTILEAALRRSERVLVRHPAQLAPQIRGRLADEDGPAVARLRAEAARHAAPGALVPKNNGWLTSAGSVFQTFEGHSTEVTVLRVLPGGRCVLSGSRDGTLRLWDIGSGALLRTLGGYESRLTLLPDGRRALAVSGKGVLRLWDLEGGALLHTLETKDDRISGLELLPDGRRVLVGHGHLGVYSGHGALQIWDLKSGDLLRTLGGDGRGVDVFAPLPDGRRALAGYSDGALQLWDLESGALLRVLQSGGHARNIRQIKPLPDGRRALTKDHFGGTLRLWDLESGGQLKALEGNRTWISGLELLPDGRRVIGGWDDYALELWDLESGARIRTIGGYNSDGHEYSGSIFKFEILPGNRHVVTSHSDHALRLWNLEDGELLLTLKSRGMPSGYMGRSVAFAVLFDERCALVGYEDRTTRLWDLWNGSELARFVGDSHTTELAAMAGGRMAVAGDVRGRVMFFDLSRSQSAVK